MITIKEAREKAKEIDAKLLAGDFNDTVRVYHEDESEMLFVGALFEKFAEYFFVFTEHHGYFVYHEDDIEDIYYE